MTVILTALTALCVPQFAAWFVPCVVIVALGLVAERWVR